VAVVRGGGAVVRSPVLLQVSIAFFPVLLINFSGTDGSAPHPLEKIGPYGYAD